MMFMMIRWYGLTFFFFFQAEDGIRDGHVTGVQTCALPISVRKSGADQDLLQIFVLLRRQHVLGAPHHRSEERRVGKECRSRCARYQLNKKINRVGEIDNYIMTMSLLSHIPIQYSYGQCRVW